MGVPFGTRCLELAVGAGELATHQVKRFQQAGNVGMLGEELPNICHGPDRQQNDFTRVVPDRCSHEFDGTLVAELAVVGPIRQYGGLLDVWLSRWSIEPVLFAGDDRDNTACRAANSTGEFRSLYRLPRDGRDAQKIAAWLCEEISEGNRVVDVRPDIGVEQNLYGVVAHHGAFYFW